MIPIGVLASARHAASAGGGAVFTDDAWSAADSAAYTFSGMGLGAATAGRLIVAVVSSRKANPAANLSSLTIGGVAATIDDAGYGSASGTRSVIASAVVPSGTTGDVVATWSATVLRCHVALFALPPATLVATGNSGTGSTTAAAQSVTLTGIAAGDLLVAGVADGFSAVPYDWTGPVTEDYEGSTSETQSFSGASGVATSTSETISADPAISSGYIALVAAAYRAA